MKRMIIALLAVGLAVGLSACDTSDLAAAGEPEYAAKDVNRDVKKALERGKGSAKITSIDCEDVEDVKKGAFADCDVVFKDGTENYYRVKFIDDEGHFWASPA